MGNLLRGPSRADAAPTSHPDEVDTSAVRRPFFHGSLDEIDLTTNSRTPRKRKKGLSFDSSADDGSKMHTPMRKKLKSTSRYIYETLFENGQDSDVTIKALGHSWRLHKVYLCQSAYFNSMFSGNWVESNRNEIDIDVPDPNVTRQALDLALGSLYKDEVVIKPVEAGNLLAAASLLQLDSLIQHCEDIMKENIGPRTVTNFYDAAVTYGNPSLRQECFSWLLKNLMTSSPEFLVGISTELMAGLVENADLFVMQVEMDVYTLLKKWAFLRLFPDWLNDNLPPPSTDSSSSSHHAAASSSSPDHSSPWSKNLASAAELHLATLVSAPNSSTSSSSSLTNAKSLLDSAVGKPLALVFRRLRLQHIVNDLNSLDILEKERIIPSSWLSPLIPIQWRHLLRLETELDSGPSAEVSSEDFASSCLRCGRILHQDVDHCWRWTGFHFGVDLLISYQKRQITIKRNTGSHKCLTSVSLQPKRNLMLCVSVGSLEPQSGRLLYEKSSPMTRLSLGLDEERVLLNVDRHAPFPLHVSVKMLFYTPTPDDFVRLEDDNLEDDKTDEETVDDGEDANLNKLSNDDDDANSPSPDAIGARRNLSLSFDTVGATSRPASIAASTSAAGSSHFPRHPSSPQSLRAESA